VNSKQTRHALNSHQPPRRACGPVQPDDHDGHPWLNYAKRLMRAQPPRQHAGTIRPDCTDEALIRSTQILAWRGEKARGKQFQRATNPPDFVFVATTYNSTDDGEDFARAYKHTLADTGADAQRALQLPEPARRSPLVTVSCKCWLCEGPHWRCNSKRRNIRPSLSFQRALRPRAARRPAGLTLRKQLMPSQAAHHRR